MNYSSRDMFSFANYCKENGLYPANENDLNGNLLKKWDCITEAQDELGFNSTVIGRAAKLSGYSYGFIWSLQPKTFKEYIHVPHSKRGGYIY